MDRGRARRCAEKRPGRQGHAADDGDHHDHMVCVETGDVIEFSNDEIERLQHEMADAHGYELLDHNLVLYVKPKSGADNDD